MILVLLCIAFAYGLVALGVWTWAAFLIVAGTCVLVAGLAVGIAFLKVRHLSGLRKTRKSVTEGIGMLRRDGKHPAVGGDSAPEISPDGQHPEIAGMASRGEVSAVATWAPDAAVQISGPWTHRSVSANGTRFHIAEAGDGPLVLLLHGFPEFWWTWRHQLAWLPEAGFRAVAVDLRGFGGSDKPPRGYDLITGASDAAGLIRSLGEANAVVVGHDWGGLIAWTLAAYHPKVVSRLAVVSMAHPLRVRSAVLTDPLGAGARERRLTRSGSSSPCCRSAS